MCGWGPRRPRCPAQTNGDPLRTNSGFWPNLGLRSGAQRFEPATHSPRIIIPCSSDRVLRIRPSGVSPHPKSNCRAGFARTTPATESGDIQADSGSMALRGLNGLARAERHPDCARPIIAGHWHISALHSNGASTCQTYITPGSGPSGNQMGMHRNGGTPATSQVDFGLQNTHQCSFLKDGLGVLAVGLYRLRERAGAFGVIRCGNCGRDHLVSRAPGNARHQDFSAREPRFFLHTRERA